MSDPATLDLSVAACPENFSDANEWSFYVVNRGDEHVSRVVLETIEWEWGDQSRVAHPQSEVTNVAPGANALLWRGDDNEVRMLLHLQVTIGEQQSKALVRFPMLYKRKNELSDIDGLDKAGWTALVSMVPE